MKKILTLFFCLFAFSINAMEKETTFKNLKINQYVNVETDVNARYIKKYVEDIIKRK